MQILKLMYTSTYDTTAPLFWNHSVGVYLQKSVGLQIAKEGDTNYYKKQI